MPPQAEPVVLPCPSTRSTSPESRRHARRLRTRDLYSNSHVSLPQTAPLVDTARRPRRFPGGARLWTATPHSPKFQLVAREWCDVQTVRHQSTLPADVACARLCPALKAELRCDGPGVPRRRHALLRGRRARRVRVAAGKLEVRGPSQNNVYLDIFMTACAAVGNACLWRLVRPCAMRRHVLTRLHVVLAPRLPIVTGSAPAPSTIPS